MGLSSYIFPYTETLHIPLKEDTTAANPSRRTRRFAKGLLKHSDALARDHSKPCVCFNRELQSNSYIYIYSYIFVCTLFILFPGGCRPPDSPHGRAGVLGDPFWVAFLCVFWFFGFFVLFVFFVCGFQAAGGSSSCFS